MTPLVVEDSGLRRAVATVPAGAWAVAVSGGADSVGLLHLLHARRPDIDLHVVHLDHETRNGASADDARFVSDLSKLLGLSVTTARRGEVESSLGELPANLSSRFRASRMELFRRVVQKYNLRGVLLAHHADDQVESVVLRLLRGNSYAGLVGLTRSSTINDLLVFRPLLDVRRSMLHNLLHANGRAWREDESNLSDDYARNRVRKWLRQRPELFVLLFELATTANALKQWVSTTAPILEDVFTAGAVASMPVILAEQSAKRWLVARGVEPGATDRPVVERLITMTTDAASPSVLEFPGGVRVRRRQGKISAGR